MIIQRQDASLLFITQPDHAALSGAIMQGWRHRGFESHPRHESIILAIREHDNGWLEIDASPLLDPSTGTPLDFMNAPADVRRGLWPRGVERLRANPWAAALVAQHAVHIYRHYRGDAEWSAFFRDLEAARDRHLRRASPLTLDDLLDDYFFVRTADLLSLTFCNAWSSGPEERGYEMRLDGNRLLVTPDPFGGAALHLTVPARRLPDRRFDSAAQVSRLFDAAPIVHLPAIFAGTVSGC